jgi:hypothetical protein
MHRTLTPGRKCPQTLKDRVQNLLKRKRRTNPERYRLALFYRYFSNVQIDLKLMISTE